MGECAICGRVINGLCECLGCGLGCGRLVCDLCFVDAVGLCGDCEEA
jgi:hypothetical protein